jgi:hypothetical protein
MMQLEFLASLWTLVGGMVALAVFSAVADWRRQRRRNLDAAGFMPWALIQVLALFAAAGAAIAALHG